MEVALLEDRVLNDSPAAQETGRAKGLGRLLVYAMLDAQDLGSDKVARALLQTIEMVKAEFRLTDRDLMRK
jgi:hypothetical protein